MKLKKGSKIKEEKSGEVQKLKNRIKKLESDKKKLISKLNRYEETFKKNNKFLREETSSISLEDLIEAANEDKSLDSVKKQYTCKKCGKTDVNRIKSLAGTLVLCECGHREMLDE